MTMLAKFFRLFAASVVPGGGFLLGEWSPATALTLYWVDTLVGAFAMGVRIGLHRHWTKVSGHDRPQLDAPLAVSTSYEEMTPVVFKSFLAEFLLTSVAFTVAHGVFLTIVLGFMSARPDADHVRQGAIAILVCHALSLSFDARRLDSWPFARLKEQAERIMGRIAFIHMLIVVGMWFSKRFVSHPLRVAQVHLRYWLASAAMETAAGATAVAGRGDETLSQAAWREFRRALASNTSEGDVPGGRG